MTRPEIIRADSIDLQDRDAPSAKDHSRVTTSTSKSSANSSLAPHQAETLREVAAETAEQRRVSWNNGDIGDLQQYAEDITQSLSGGSASAARSTNKMAASQQTTQQQQQQQQRQDALAIAQNGGASGQDNSDDEMDGDGDDDGMDDDMMGGVSSSPSIDDEDIDFQFVYALHTFVATVEGQANATKGDTMELLDDTNSYWWLVRVAKDGSIGYLPAEHIETPTERLARLNKHRNIDLSASMLEDQNEKAKKPLKSAMRWRKAKAVTFAPPTYVDYSDFDYATDEEEQDPGFFGQQKSQQQQQQATAEPSTAEDEAEDETAKVEPLKTRAQKDGKATEDAKVAVNGENTKPRSSEEIFEASKSETPGPTRTKDGTVRDSFFKDDTVETKKITLTPNLLRDDGQPRSSSDSKDLKQRPSLDKMDKESILSKDDKKKKDKKEKEKKPSGFRSLFSRKSKDKVGEDDDSSGKPSVDLESNAKESVDFEEDDDKSLVPQRNPSKLQKQQPRTEPSPTRGKPGAQGGPQQKQSGMDMVAFLSESKLNTVANVPPATMRIVESDSPAGKNATREDPFKQGPSRKPQGLTKAKSRIELDDFDSTDEEMAAEPMRPAPEPQRPAPVPEDRLRQQQKDRQPELQQQQERPQPQQAQSFRPTLPGAFPDSFASTQSTSSVQTERAAPLAVDPQASRERERLSESPVQVSPVASNNPPALMVDTSSQEDHSSPISSPSPDLLDPDDEHLQHHHQTGGMMGPGGIPHQHRTQDSLTASTTSATTTASTTHTGNTGQSSTGTGNNATWNDASLRAFFESSADVRDMLVVVYDKTEVPPAGPDHPVVGTLFKEQNARLAEITTQLDNMLGDYLARKQRLRGTL